MHRTRCVLYFAAYVVVLSNRGTFLMFHPKRLIQTVAAVCLTMLLSGCVIEPWGPFFHHHHHGGY
jgi:hypothetical protein